MSCTFSPAMFLKRVLPVTLCMAHLTEYLPVAAHDTLDRIIRSVGIVRGFGRHAAFGIDILERHLPVLEQLAGQRPVHDELASPWLTAIEWISPTEKLDSHGELVVATRVETICDT